jgi:uncharacterized protein
MVLCVVGMLMCCAATAQALDVPPLRGRVNDLAGILSPEVAKRLDAALAAFEASDSTQVAVLTVPSLAGDTIEGFSIKTAQKWGIGQKGKDNGVLLVVSKGDREVRIEVGRGLEGVLTDALSGRIIDHVIVPEFKKGDFNTGVEQGVDKIIAAVRGEYKGEGGGGSSEMDDETSSLLFGSVICLVVMSVLRFLPGVVRAGLGGVGMGILAAVFSSGLVMILLMAVIGVILGFIAPYIFRGGRGGGTWGGGSSGGGGGGFSGGGGSFSGGGSSGKW